MYCDFCKSTKLTTEYKPKTTKRDISILVCNQCDLIQSWPRKTGIYGRTVAVSGDADWGNVRYGKLQSLNHSITFMKNHINFQNYNNFLDIGANRGAFIKYIQKNYKEKKITAIENDKIIFDEEIQPLENIIKINDMFERVILDNKFDFIHSSHTLEHLVSPGEAMKKTRELIEDDGICYLEVPNVKCITDKDNITEFFIDKHLFHFSEETLETYIYANNFKILAKKILPTFLCYILTTSKKDASVSYPKIKVSKTMMKIYSKRIKEWKDEIVIIKENLMKITKDGNTAVWGLGRIFDILFKNDAFKDTDIEVYIDKNLPEFISKIKNKTVNRPEILNTTNVKNIVVCADIFFDEISNEIKQYNKNINIFHYKKLLKSKI